MEVEMWLREDQTLATSLSPLFTDVTFRSYNAEQSQVQTPSRIKEFYILWKSSSAGFSQGHVPNVTKLWVSVLQHLWFFTGLLNTLGPRLLIVSCWKLTPFSNFWMKDSFGCGKGKDCGIFLCIQGLQNQKQQWDYVLDILLTLAVYCHFYCGFVEASEKISAFQAR